MAPSTRKKHRLPLLLFTLISIFILVFLFLVYKKRASPPAIDEIEQNKLELSETAPGVKKETDSELSIQQKSPELLFQKNTDASPEINLDVIPESPKFQCTEVSNNISEFLAELSEKKYIEAYEIKGNLSDYLNRIIIKLLNNPPEITGESDDLFSIFKNGAHFYRILGPKDVSLIKDILIYEGDGLENILAEFYRWSQISTECQHIQTRFSMPLNKLYEYSCFFLNTLGGQSYLFRRESRTRILITYYSLLVLHNAEQNGLNKYSLSVANSLPPIIEDMQNAHFLINQDQYINKLVSIQNSLEIDNPNVERPN